MAQSLVRELGILREEPLKRLQLHQALDIVQRLPACEQFEVGQRYRDLGLVIGVPEFIRIFSMQLLGEAFVRVDLKGKSFAKGENLLLSVERLDVSEVCYLWQVRDLGTITIQHRLANKLRVLLQIVRKQFPCG